MFEPRVEIPVHSGGLKELLWCW